MYKSVIYVVNEIKGVTTALHTDSDFNIVRDYRGDGKAFTAVSINQPNVPAVIITAWHKYETEMIEIAGGQRRFWTKTSPAIRIANTLYKRGITVTLIDYRGKNKTKVTIEPDDNFYTKINEFCGVDTKRVNKFSKEASKISQLITWESFIKLGENPFKIFSNKETFEKNLQIFVKYADIYGLDYQSPVDMLTFLYIRQHKEIIEDYVDGTKFICPHCGSVVTVNGYEKFVKGKLVKTGHTVCETCYTAYKIHDKRDVLRFAKCVAKQKSRSARVEVKQ